MDNPVREAGWSWPLVTIVIINSRGGELFEDCLASCKRLFYPKAEIIAEENLDRSRSIGKCWNDAVKDAKGDWVLFVGDDDIITPDYLISLMLTWKTALGYIKEEQVVCITSYCTLIMPDDSRQGFSKHPTGMWRRDYLLENPFREDLEKHVDSEYFERMTKNDKEMLLCYHNHGYFYRQHADKASGEIHRVVDEGKVKLKREVKGIYLVSRWMSFVKPIEQMMNKYYPVLMSTAFSESSAKLARIIWCDWADDNAVLASRFKTDAPKILRVRSYEAFRPWMEEIDFDAFDYILFTNEHIRDYLENRLERKFGKKARIIPNGVDLTKFSLTEKRNNKVAWVGFIANKKGVNLLLLVARHFPEYEFHVAGSVQEKDVGWYFDTRKTDNVFFEGYQGDMNEFYKDKTYILNTSPREGNPNSVMEAMACGCKPLIYAWPGAEKIYGEWVWKDLAELQALLEGDVTNYVYRDFIVKNYNLVKCFQKHKVLIDRLWTRKLS